MHMNRYLIIYACLASFLIACSGESSSGPTSGNSFYRNENGSVSTPQEIDYSKEALTDSRDGQTYKTVKIGSQIWMAENLNYGTENSYCYDNNVANCSKYGRLYTWAAAMTACPSGWHLPSNIEWETLFTSVGGKSTAGTKLKSTSGWPDNGNGTDAYGFSALPAGHRRGNGYFYGGGMGADFWSASENINNSGYNMDLSCHDDPAFLGFDSGMNHAFSVRCVKN
ncbi:MAG: fibrobacter succinogenes major paralogous domain-containing protein [Fibrobacter sp.]|nr:fibrobacter succinogenes major paralogous domain-containing protein [Fibrobacter sp.]